MGDPLSVAAGVIAILQLSSKVITYINGTRGAKDARKRLRDELRSCEYILLKLKDHANDLDDGDLWSETFGALEKPDAPLHRLKITLSLVIARLEPKKGFAKALSSLMWPFSEKEMKDLIAAIGREMGLLEFALNNDSLRLIQENTKVSTKNTIELTQLINTAKANTIQASEDSTRQLEGLMRSLRVDSMDAWKDNAAQLTKLTTTLESIQEDLSQQPMEDAGHIAVLLDSIRGNAFQERTEEIVELLNLANQTLTEDRRERLNQYTKLIEDIQGRSAESSLSAKAISETLSGVQGRLGQLHHENNSKKDDKKREAILQWLSPVDYSLQQSDFINRRQPGTGKWFLESAEFQKWTEESNTLFCPGIPGAGKTILTSIVIEYLQHRYRDNDRVVIAYIYFNHKTSAGLNAVDLLANLLKQFVRILPSLPQHLESLYNAHIKHGTRPSIQEYASALLVTATLQERVFVVIDALDEYQGANGSRESLLSEIFALQKQTQTNFLATSRYNPDISELFHDSTQREIRASDQDVNDYINAHMAELPRCVRGDLKLQRNVKMTIVEAVDGM